MLRPVLSVGTCAMAFVAAFSSASYAQSPNTDAEIRAEALKGSYDEYRAEQFGKRHGSAALPVLSQLLCEETEPGVKARAAFLLGKLGDSGGLEPMKAFLERAMPSALRDGAYRDVWTTMVGIGFLGTKEAIGYLATLTTESYWRKRFEKDGVTPTISYKGRERNAAESLLRLRCDAILALGASGKPEARAVLEELRRKSDDPRILAETERKIEDCLLRERVAAERQRLAREGVELSREELGRHLVETFLEEDHPARRALERRSRQTPVR